MKLHHWVGLLLALALIVLISVTQPDRRSPSGGPEGTDPAATTVDPGSSSVTKPDSQRDREASRPVDDATQESGRGASLVTNEIRARFAKGDMVARIELFEELLNELGIEAAFAAIVKLLNKIHLNDDRILYKQLENLLASLAMEQPGTLPFFHETLLLADNEVERFLAWSVLNTAYQEEVYQQPLAKSFLAAFDASQDVWVRNHLVSSIGRMHSDDIAESMIEDCLESGDLVLLEGALIGLEVLLESQAEIRQRLRFGEALHPALEDQYFSPTEVRNSRSIVIEALGNTALDHQSDPEILHLVLQQLVDFEAEDELWHVRRRWQNDELVHIVMSALNQVR